MTNTDNATGLQGRWVFIETGRSGDEIHFKIGQIIMSIGQQHLVRLRPAHGAPPYSQFDDLLTDGTYIFDSEAELDKYLEWAVGADEGSPRVVPMRKDLS